MSIEENAKANKNNQGYKELSLLLYDIANGIDSFWWNGKITIETHTRFVCLDTHSLQNTSDNNKRT